MRHSLFEAVRGRFQQTCGYCGVTEITVGGELTIDHYRPRAAGGSDDQDNLVYACVRCNQYKGVFWPDSVDLAHGRRVLHPDVDDISAHIAIDENTGYLHGLTPTGIFHIALLRLNRPQLVSHRLAHRLQGVLEEKIRLLEQQNAELQKTISAQERYLELLKAQAIERRFPP
jgi:hypothetical protein